MNSPQLGVTLYSFNADYYSYRYSFEDCLAAVGSLGAGQGVEVVAPQMIRGYPHLTPEFEYRFRTLLDRYGLVPTAYGGYAEPGRFVDRPPTRSEQIEHIGLQLRAAARLGFGVIRLQPDASDVIIDELLPLAERLNVKIGFEIHAPMTFTSLEPLIERVARADTPYVGFIPDSGAFCHSTASIYVNRFAQQGVPAEIRDHIVTRWKDRIGGDVLRDEVAALGGDSIAQLMATESSVYFGHEEPSVLAELLPYIVHVHAKFFGIDETGTDSGVRFPEIIKVLVNGGYDGFLSCEYEGHHWNPDLSAIDQIRTVQKFIRGEIEAAPGVDRGDA